MRTIDLTGVGVALVTPFHHDRSVDYEGLQKLVEHCINNGVDYLVVNGTTSENPTLTTEEKLLILQTVISKAQDRVPVIYGVGGNSTQALVEEISNFDVQGVAAILSASPYYNKPTQEGIYQHYAALSQCSVLPIILYNVPGRTSSNISAETTVRLAKDFGNIVAIKEASGNLDQITEILINRPDGFQVISGDDNLTLHMMLLGAEGVISVSGQGVPEIFCKLVDAALEGDFYSAREAHLALFDLTNLLFAEGNPAGIKALLKLRGLCGDTVRLPLVSASANLTEQLQTALSGLEI
ncbi:MAG TPA: 4-hydroxy-tetrahydrodipicolinate synthase [Cryomorphaceae bacterium]|nr:4-hydroxy-tetrahydrodipicolinate synthase [Cryomorphaceae bacterium]|tara:strand:- start:245 stop:1132 length:888 start_codon:yes stop_codon:yes gene_type:complete